jgi:pimeloyl-ACP methyl ester carboxylesterase
MKAQRLYLPIFCMLAVCIFTGCQPEDFLDGFDKTALFASPTQAEINAIRNDWQTRNLPATNYTVLQEKQIVNGKFTLKIVSFYVDGVNEYGALLIPTSQQKLPVRMLVGGFGLGQTTNALILKTDSTISTLSFILAIPALRGQSLEITINDTVYISPLSAGNHCDAFDEATDDVLAFLNVIQTTESIADVTRTAVRGGSRGGTVALLAGIRDSRIKRVVTVAGPTDFLPLNETHVNDKTYQCQFLNDLKTGRKDIAATRYKIIASSPLYFAQSLPLSQIHMGMRDTNVPIAQGYALKDKLTELGMASRLEFYTYDRAHSDIATNNNEMGDRIEQFLSKL